MTRSRKVRRAIVLATAFTAALWLADRVMSTRSLADDAATAPASQPAASRPVVSADAQVVLDRLAATYAARPLRIEGEIKTDFDVAGIVEQKALAISGLVKSPQAYRHEAKGKLVITADGATLHFFDVAANQYADAKEADQSADAVGTRSDVRMVMLEQNPAMFIALGNDPADAISLGGAAIELLAPATEAGRSFDRLESRVDGAVRTTWIDHQRGTIDRVAYDFAPELVARGAAQVKRAAVTLTFSTMELGGPAPDDAAFAFAPPADATPIQRAAPRGELMTGEPSALEGRPAADFELKDMDGTAVKLSDAKGSVVVLDFWATWCPPCRAGLPHLAAAAEKFKGKGIKVYAVNQQEDRETVAKFLAEQKLALVALLDVDGAVGQKFGVSGIPQTVVIGRDGKISKVFVGFDESDTNALPAAIEAALN